jgi:hypothetical protein
MNFMLLSWACFRGEYPDPVPSAQRAFLNNSGNSLQTASKFQMRVSVFLDTLPLIRHPV